MTKPFRSLLLAAALALIPLSAARAADAPTFGHQPDRNMASPETNLPERFDPGLPKPAPASQPATQPAKLNLKWTARLGSQTWSTPVIANGRIYIGTNNANPRDPRLPGNRSVLLCLNEADGTLLWQLVTRRPDYQDLGQVSSPTVEGDRVYILTGQVDMLCLDAKGLANGNDGPCTDELQYLARSAPPHAPNPPVPILSPSRLTAGRRGAGGWGWRIRGICPRRD